MTPDQKKVMIVEDEPDAAELFAEMMRISGFDVVKLLGAPAVSTLAREKPDVVILDVMMPEVSGVDMLRSMQHDPDLAEIPVIVVSAKSLPSDIQTGLEAGASLYLTKPVGFLDLRQAVDRVLQGDGTRTV